MLTRAWDGFYAPLALITALVLGAAVQLASAGVSMPVCLLVVPAAPKQQVAPYLRGWESVIGHQRTGVYGNSKTIDWALQDGLGCYFWQHNWGSPGGRTHPAANLHQVESDKRNVGGVGVDINNICKPQFGQWA